jgi:anti-sigma B factor antagonist
MEMVRRHLRETFHKFGELAVLKKLARPEDIVSALSIQRADLQARKVPQKLGTILVKNKILTPQDVKEILEEQKISRGERDILKLNLYQDPEGLAILELKGRLDHRKFDRLKGVLERLMDKGVVKLMVDMSKIVYLDGKGLSVFIPYIDETRIKGGDIKFLCNFRTRPIFDKIGLSPFVQIFENREVLIRAFQQLIDEYMLKGALGELVSTPRSRYFHYSYCSLIRDIAWQEKLFYPTHQRAVSAGKIPCPKCKP